MTGIDQDDANIFQQRKRSHSGDKAANLTEATPLAPRKTQVALQPPHFSARMAGFL
jgi:hypothetical protein